MAVVQTLSILLVLLTSSSLAALQVGDEDGPSPDPAVSEICSRASWLAIQGLRNVSQALSDLKALPSENFSSFFLYGVSQCLDSLARAEFKIRKAIKEGPEQSSDYYEPPNRYDEALVQMRFCDIVNPITNESLPAYGVAIALINSAKELCF